MGSYPQNGAGVPTPRSQLRLTGSRCQCRGCFEYFNSSGVFALHRVGDWKNNGANRRCLTVEEMTARGWLKNAPSFWIRSRRPHVTRRNGDRSLPATGQRAPLSGGGVRAVRGAAESSP